MKNYSAIILAAGYSSRMGKFKPLMDIYGSTAVERNIDLFQKCGINNIMVVTGYLNELIESKIKNKCKVVFNKDYDKGMYSSIKTGVRALSKDNEAFFILPSDIPSVKSNTILTMIKSYEGLDKGILFPTFLEEKGHPVLISSFFLEEILKSNPKEGLREILNCEINCWNFVKVADRGILLDMDTKDDFDILLKHIEKEPYPDYLECMEILRLCNVRKDTIEHMKKVSEYALKVTGELSRCGCILNEKAVYAGALLHDVAKGEKEHGKKGAEIVEHFGYGCLKEIISEHMKLKTNNLIGNKEIVYVCDKLIKGTEYVSLQERFKEALIRYENEKFILNEVNKKLEDADAIKRKIEDILGYSMEKLR